MESTRKGAAVRRIGGIRTFEDEAFQRWMLRASGAVLAGMLIVVLVWALVPAAPDLEVERWAGGGFDMAAALLWLAALFAGLVAALVAHEAVHALLFKAFAPRGARVTFGAAQGMVYACAEGVMYTRVRYLAVALAPSVAVTALVAVGAAAVEVSLWGLLVGGLHLSGCTGDWGYARAIRRDPAIRWCEDTAWGVAFYGEDRAASGREEDR